MFNKFSIIINHKLKKKEIFHRLPSQPLEASDLQIKHDRYYLTTRERERKKMFDTYRYHRHSLTHQVALIRTK